jgi:hypothetical protein
VRGDAGGTIEATEATGLDAAGAGVPSNKLSSCCCLSSDGLGGTADTSVVRGVGIMLGSTCTAKSAAAGALLGAMDEIAADAAAAAGAGAGLLMGVGVGVDRPG